MQIFKCLKYLMCQQMCLISLKFHKERGMTLKNVKTFLAISRGFWSDFFKYMCHLICIIIGVWSKYPFMRNVVNITNYFMLLSAIMHFCRFYIVNKFFACACFMRLSLRRFEEVTFQFLVIVMSAFVIARSTFSQTKFTSNSHYFIDGM